MKDTRFKDCKYSDVLDINEVLHVKLKSLMKERRITQYDLSAMIDIAQPQISNYVRGFSVPSFQILVKIARALNVSLDEFTHLD